MRKPTRLRPADFEPAINPFDSSKPWPPTRSQTREHKRRAVSLLHARYNATKNPIYVWEAYAEARSTNTKLPVPAWVHSYFDSAWRNLMVLKHRKRPGRKRIAPAIAEALGFVPGGVAFTELKNSGPHPLDMPKELRTKLLRKRHGDFNPFAEDDRAFMLARAVYLEMLNDGSTPYKASEKVGPDYDADHTTAQRAWKKYAPQFPKILTKERTRMK